MISTVFKIFFNGSVAVGANEKIMLNGPQIVRNDLSRYIASCSQDRTDPLYVSPYIGTRVETYLLNYNFEPRAQGISLKIRRKKEESLNSKLF